MTYSCLKEFGGADGHILKAKCWEMGRWGGVVLATDTALENRAPN